MGHITLKPSKEYKIKLDPNELKKIDIPEDSKSFIQKYMTSQQLSDEDNLDIMMVLEDRITFGFDYLHGKTKRFVIEINPVTIFYSNAVMSFGLLQEYRNLLLSQSQEVSQIGKNSTPFDLSHAGIYFQLAINCIINLQASLESFANRIIPENYHYLDKKGNPVIPTVTFKLYNAIPKLKNIDFQQRKHRKYNLSIDKLIKLRNDIIHLKPSGETNTGYKGVYRDLLNFDYTKAKLAVKTFINFYEPNLIEECSCGNDYYFHPAHKNSQNGL